MTMTDADILNAEKVTPRMAAEYLKCTIPHIYAELQAGTAPYGSAAQMPGGRWSYLINAPALVAFRNGASPAFQLLLDEVRAMRVEIDKLVEEAGY